jgi:hypothetical protein
MSQQKSQFSFGRGTRGFCDSVANDPISYRFTWISTDKWDEQVFRIGETVTHEKAIAAPHRESSTQTG